MNYHARQAASTAMHGSGASVAPERRSAGQALNTARFDAYTGVSINNERR